MKATHLPAIFYIVLVCSGFVFGNTEKDDSLLNVVEIIEKYGYPAETHRIETEDGYLLEIQRIPHGKNRSNGIPGIPLLVTHGLFADSSEFLFLKEISFPFLAADRGYDVWLANFRGNNYGMRHRYMSPDSAEFWNFSWHESGIYDLPAQLDYICNYTRRGSVLMLGYSMGVTVNFVMASERPDYQKKIRGAVMLAPVATARGVKHSIALLAPFANFIKFMSVIFSRGKLFNNNPYDRQVTKISCNSFPKRWHVCRNIIFMMSGADPTEFNEERLHVLLGHMPTATSMKNVAHYLQLVKSGKFQQYDYGPIKNFNIYKSFEPPEYNLKSITIPISMMIAPKDVFIGREDVDFLIKQLPNVRSVEAVDFSDFTHLDFFIARHADTLVYNKVFKMFEDILLSAR